MRKNKDSSPIYDPQLAELTHPPNFVYILIYYLRPYHIDSLIKNHRYGIFAVQSYTQLYTEMTASDGEEDTQTILFDGNRFHRFRPRGGNTRNKVNFRDDTLIHTRCCPEVKEDLEIGQPDDFEYAMDDNQLTVMTLPAEFMRRPSMVSIRMKRDQLFKGTRTRRNPRVISKNGLRNITFQKIPERTMLFFKDFVTSLIEEQWRYTLMIFALSFFCSWMVFAFIWYVIALSHGDLDFDERTGERLSDGPQPCVEKARSLAGFLLFSIETQMGIGFGNKYPTEECPEAVIVVMLQSIIGVAIEGAMVGIVFAKMTRPPKIPSELQFSRKATVCLRDGKLCLLFRVCDYRQKHVISTRIQAFFFDEKKRLGRTFKYLRCNLQLENDGKLFLIWPTTVVHVIDSKSPLYAYSAHDLMTQRFEIVVTILGSSPSTGQLSETKSSYLSKEIHWGHRFQNMITYDYDRHTYVAHYDRLDMLVPVDTPLCSAMKLEKVCKDLFGDKNTSTSDTRWSSSPIDSGYLL